jgi:hypothetical protein
MAMKRTGKALIFAFAVAWVSILACSTSPKLTGGFTSAGDRTGRIGMQFTLPTGATISAVHWEIAGPTNSSGDVTTGNTSIEFVVGGLLAGAYNGSGQGITLTATDSQGDHCSSPQTGFTVVAGGTTQLVVQMTCFHSDGGVLMPKNGSLEVDAGVNVVAVPTCPIITSFSVTPAEEPEGSTSFVQVITNPAGSLVTYTSSNTAVGRVTSNSDASPPGSSATLLCVGPGQTQLTVATTVPLPDGGSCPPSTMSALINCEATDASISCRVAGETFCTGTGCTNLQTDANNCGTCGQACASGQACSMGVCCTGLQGPCNAVLASINVAGHLPPHTYCNTTELAIFQTHPVSGDAGTPGDCLRCAYDNGVLDLTGVTTNAECEDLGSAVCDAGPAGLGECEATLACDLGLTAGGTDSCGDQLYTGMADPMGTLAINAFCGAGVLQSACETGGALGACQTQWRAGFCGQSDSFIVLDVADTGYPSGMANSIASLLLVNCAPQCFGNSQVVAPPTCPSISSLSVRPNQEPVGSTSLAQVTTDPSGSPLTYSSSNTAVASVTSNSDASPPGTSATVLCTNPGQSQLTVSTTAALPDGGSCPPSTMSASITCEPVDGGPCIPASLAFCSGVGCVDLQSDSQNCGTCGHACASGLACVSGACTQCAPNIQSQCDAVLAGISIPSGGTTYHPRNSSCSATELAVYQKVPQGTDAGAAGACLICAFDNAVLDLTPSGVADNVECEDLGVYGDGGTSAGIAQCEATLDCDVGLSPNGTDGCGHVLYTEMANPMGTLLINAFCGAGVSSSTCVSGGAIGACQNQWRAGFEGNNDGFIQSNNSNLVYPSGMANNIASALLTNCASQCFP